MTLDIDALERTYPTFALGPLSVTVEDEVVSVLGPSGCGKTTLLSLVAGLTTPTAGQVQLNDRDITDASPNARRVTMVFQEGALFPHLNARENIAYATDSADIIESLADTLEITGVLNQMPTALSGGERQRVALARAIAADPAALLLDEPLANLDTPIRQRLQPDIRAVLETLDIPVIHVTHDQRAAATIGDRVAVMHDGHIEQIGEPESVFTRPRTRFVAEFTGNTILSTTVADRNGDLILDWCGAAVTGAPASTTPGDRVTVAVHPTAPTLQPGATTTEDAVNGRVTASTFEGDRHRITVTVTDTDTTIDITRPPERTDLPDIDDEVTITIPGAAVHVLDTQPPQPPIDHPESRR